MDIRRRTFVKGAAAVAALVAAGFPVSGLLVQQAEAADAGISWGKSPVAFVEPICRSSVAIVGLVSGPVLSRKF